MKIPTKKLNSGFEMPVFGLGTWQMGGRETHDPGNDDQKDISAIRTAVELGITHIDTAESYAAGYAETLIGRAIKGFDRTKLFIVSKVHREHLNYDDVLRSCEQSLKRLQTEYLDLYLIHSPNPEVPIEETLKAMDNLLEDGLIRNIGVSNFKTERLSEAQKHTRHKLVVNQVYYSLQAREPEHEGLLGYCQGNDLFLEAYRPLEKGTFLDNHISLFHELTKKYGKTPAQIAINWLISQKNVITIFKTSTVEHLKENLGAIGWNLDKDDVENLKKSFPNQQERDVRLPLI